MQLGRSRTRRARRGRFVELDHFFKVLGAEDDVGERLGAEHLGEFRFCGHCCCEGECCAIFRLRLEIRFLE